MQDAYIFDIDGTLADCSQRVYFITPPEGAIHFNLDEIDWEPDWESFYKDCVNDKPITNVVNLLKIIAYQNIPIMFITGRPENYRGETVKWLCKVLDMDPKIFYIQCELYMRPVGDHRKDYEYKKWIWDTKVKDNYDINGVFEDRTQCVNMWRSLGLTCFQVNNGDY